MVGLTAVSPQGMRSKHVASFVHSLFSGVLTLWLGERVSPSCLSVQMAGVPLVRGGLQCIAGVPLIRDQG